MNELENLIEQYQHKLLTIKEEIVKNIGKMKVSRLEVKASCYRTFLTELKRLKTYLDEN